MSEKYEKNARVGENETKQCSLPVRINSRSIEKDLSSRQEGSDLSEIPFLVTHWLSEYQLPENRCEGLDDNEIQKRNEAMQKIHRAASDIASAFSSLAAFGTSIVQSSLKQPYISRQSTIENRTYFDMKRQWASNCPPNQLEVLVNAAKVATDTVDSTVAKRNDVSAGFATNLVASARENFINAIHKPKSGRTLIDVHSVPQAVDETDIEINANNHMNQIALRSPVLLLKNTSELKENTNRKTVANDPLTYIVQSSQKVAAVDAATAFRRFFEIRLKHSSDDAQVQSTSRSLQYNKNLLSLLIQQRNSLLANQFSQALGLPSSSTINPHDKATNSPESLLNAVDEIDCREQSCKRVIAQLERQIPASVAALERDSIILSEARYKLSELYKKSQDVSKNYSDPVPVAVGKDFFLNNRLLSNLQSRQLGYIDRCLGRTIASSMGRTRHLGAHIENNRSMLYNRFSHAATINTHLHYPIYCLRFDQTGRYFITGADDSLVRVFCLGDSIIPKKHGLVDRSTYCRGAVLVCTLKGHAGVVNDVCVSSDNAFLATASEDGDCRVWGLKDGCPVAILRGHKGGANMVSWSTLTPYRLVTTSADGFARVWDIREACLKRYGNVIGRRPEYTLKIKGKSSKETTTDNQVSVLQEQSRANVNNQVSPIPDIPLPPLPERVDGTNQLDAMVVDNNNVNNDNVQPGEFIYNDLIDEGVKIISKLQHERVLAAVTDSARQIPPKVICVARCPYGNHFATGSDDGICRIWREEDDMDVDKIDAELCSRRKPGLNSGHTTRKSTDPLLFLLRAHVNAITDLVYSSAGDRILTASQKDGEVKIVSWRPDQSQAKKSGGNGSPVKRASSGNSSFIQIKLVNPKVMASAAVSATSKRRVNRAPTTHRVSCDVATWLKDDSKIVTSQSELAKADGSEIVPGSHYLFLWDSFTGNCLVGIAGAHSKPCPVLLAHPIDSNIICTAGTDGIMKLWDWQCGKCIFSYSNIGTFGPLEDDQVGKQIGFLDGSFSPDGTNLVLTDDSGRVSLFDCNKLNSSKATSCPDWMREQYFSNDYYDLMYDETGYCVEKGSEQPPHLAPRGSRASHTGEPVDVRTTEVFSRLFGPLPLTEQSCRLRRERIRIRAEAMIDATQFYREKLEKYFDPLNTILLADGSGLPVVLNDDERDADLENSIPRSSQNTNNNTTRSAQTGRALSSNWRWGDAYADDLRAGEVEAESASDDEEFEINETHAQEERDRRIDYLDDFSRGSDDESRHIARERGAFSSMTSRVSSRRRRSRFHDSEEETDDGEVEEVLSTNNHPSGPFTEDYNYHLFKLHKPIPLSRSWVRRVESKTSYDGRKKYTPQIGDLVVYIPRAHLDTINNFDILAAPWKDWPSNFVWPAVQCKVRNIRYRFPFLDVCNKGLNGSSCNSVVAILTLEIVGVPTIVNDHSSAWPNPSFARSPESIVFELSVFESNHVEFIIPSSLYTSRLERLECVDADRLSDHKTRVEVYFVSEDAREDEEFISYTGTLIRFEDESDDLVDPVIRGSGHNCITVEWDGGSVSRCSPWDIKVLGEFEADYDSFCLSVSEKKTIRRVISKFMDLQSYSAFKSPVDETRYIDYSLRVAVPIDLLFVLRRIDSDYYSTNTSLVADIRLIVENCIKYNGESDNLSLLAKKMLESVENEILSPEESTSFREFNKPLPTGPYLALPHQDHMDGGYETNARRRTGRANHMSRNPRASRTRDTTTRRSSYLSVLSRSSLESLPPPRRPNMNRQHTFGAPTRRNQNSTPTRIPQNDSHRLRSHGIQRSNDISSGHPTARRRSIRRREEVDVLVPNVARASGVDSTENSRNSELQLLRDQRATRRNGRRVVVSSSSTSNQNRDQLATDSLPFDKEGSWEGGTSPADDNNGRSTSRRSILAKDSLAELEQHDSDESSKQVRHRSTRARTRNRVNAHQQSSRSEQISAGSSTNRTRATRSQNARHVDSEYIDEREKIANERINSSTSMDDKESGGRPRRIQKQKMSNESSDSDTNSSNSESVDGEEDSDNVNAEDSVSPEEESSDGEKEKGLSEDESCNNFRDKVFPEEESSDGEKEKGSSEDKSSDNVKENVSSEDEASDDIKEKASSEDESSDNASDGSNQKKRTTRRKKGPARRRKPSPRMNSHLTEGRIGREPQHKFVIKLRSSNKRPSRRSSVGQKTYQEPSSEEFDENSVAESAVESSSGDSVVELETKKEKSVFESYTAKEESTPSCFHYTSCERMGGTKA